MSGYLIEHIGVVLPGPFCQSSYVSFDTFGTGMKDLCYIRIDKLSNALQDSGVTEGQDYGIGRRVETGVVGGKQTALCSDRRFCCVQYLHSGVHAVSDSLL